MHGLRGRDILGIRCRNDLRDMFRQFELAQCELSAYGVHLQRRVRRSDRRPVLAGDLLLGDCDVFWALFVCRNVNRYEFW